MALTLTYAASDKKAAGKQGAAYYQARAMLDFLGSKLGLNLIYQPFEADAQLYPVMRPFDLTRSAKVLDQASGTMLGMVGEYKPSVIKKLKLPRYSAGFELDFAGLRTALAETGSRYLALPRFPKVTQDICLKIAAAVTYQELYEFAWQQLQGQLPDNALATLDPVDIYQRDDDTTRKQITLRLSIASYERTLTDAEVTKLLDHVAMTAAERFHAERV